MKRSLRLLFLLVLAGCIMTMTALADMGPKSQLVVRFESAPSETYYLDLLAEGTFEDDPSAFDGLDWSYSEEEIALLDKDLLESLRNAVPEGWHACTAQGSTGAPMWGNLYPDDKGLHSFGYHGVPRTYRILIVTESGEVWMSDTYTRTALQSSATVDWETKEVSIPSVWTGYALQFLATFLPTLLMEGLILFLFRYRQKRSWVIFGIANLATQGALAVALSVEAVQHGVSWGFLSLLVIAEGIILVVEAVAYVVLWKEHDRERAISCALVSNAASALIGWLISEPVWRFVVSIS